MSLALWNTQEFNSPLLAPTPLHASVGVELGGSALVETSRECGCYSLTLPVSQAPAIALGGSALVLDWLPRGGVRVGGQALISVPDDAFDGFSGFWLLSQGGSSVGAWKDESRAANHATGGGLPGGNSSHTPLAGLDFFACRAAARLEAQPCRWAEVPPDHLAPTSPFTVSVWVLDRGAFQSQVWYSRGSDDSTGPHEWAFTFGRNQLGLLEAQFNTPDGPQYALGSKRIPEDRWVHVACVWVPGVGVSFYVDATLDRFKTLPTVTSLAPTNAGAVGCWNDQSRGCTASISELRLYSGALTPAHFALELASCRAQLVAGPEVELS